MIKINYNLHVFYTFIWLFHNNDNIIITDKSIKYDKYKKEHYDNYFTYAYTPIIVLKMALFL